MKNVKEILKYLFAPRIVWKIRYVVGKQRTQIYYMAADNYSDAIDKLKKKIGEKFKVISCKKFNGEDN